MKEVNLHYYIPENEGELAELVEETVGVKISKFNHAEPMVYMGLFPEHIAYMGLFPESISEAYEFVRQGINGKDGDDLLLERIWGFRKAKNEIEFSKDGVCISENHIKVYHPNTYEYRHRLSLLQKHNLWKNPLEAAIA